MVMMDNDIQKFFPLSMLITAIILMLIFKNLYAVLFPLITVFLSLLWTMGLKVIVGSPITPVSTTLFALITVIGIANSIHLISHFRIESSAHRNRKSAMLKTYQAAGKPCLLTSATTAAGFGSLSISHIPAIRELGIFAAFGIMTAFILSMIIIPSVLLLIRLKPNAIKKENHKSLSLELSPKIWTVV